MTEPARPLDDPMCWEQLEHRASLLLSRADYVKWLERPDVVAIKARDRRPRWWERTS